MEVSPKSKYYLGCFVMSAALILPWYSMSVQTNLGAFGGADASNSVDGTKVTGGYLIIVLALAAAYCKYKDLEWSVLCVLANILIGVLALLKKLSVNGRDIGLTGSFSFKGVSVGTNIDYGYGLFVLLASAAFCFFLDINNFKKITSKLK